jgi:acyl-CoA reductase-like NAD-dependent aldehyde dehydrogenase
VHADQYEDVVAKLAEYVSAIPVGNGLDPKSLIGALTNKMQLDTPLDWPQTPWLH